MPRKILNHLFSLALLLVLVSPAAARDLELKCRPIFGEEDFRSVRPEYTWEVTASYTYYLFDNADLLHYRVRLVNIGPEPARVGNLDWPDGLRVELSRDGVALEPDTVRLELLRRTVIDTRYYLEGEPLDGMRFKRRDNGWRGSEPLQNYDDRKKETREVDLLPQMIGTYQSLVVEFAIVDAEGAPLPHGVYRVDFADPQAGLRCEYGQQLVLRRPETDLDVVDDHIVRYRFHEARGDLEAAGEELRLATERVPNNLKGWYFRAAHAFATGDLEGRLEAVERQRTILQQAEVAARELGPAALDLLTRKQDRATRALEGRPSLEVLVRRSFTARAKDSERLAHHMALGGVSRSVQVLSRGLVMELDELRAQVEAARSAAGIDLGHPDS